jgi:hypothetical protein
MKISKEQKKIICLSHSLGINGAQLARSFKVTPQYINKILRESEASPNYDFRILVKMIPAFIQAGLKVELSEEEISRVKEINGVLESNA